MSTQDAFDLDAAVAGGAGVPFPFTWGGKPFALESLMAMDIQRQLSLISQIELLDMANADPAKLLEVVTLVIGDDLLARMRKVKPVGGAALMTLIRQWMAHQGDLGKSPVPRASSAATARPSKQTSRSTRARKTN